MTDIVITAKERYDCFKSGWVYGASGRPLHHASICGVRQPVSMEDFEKGFDCGHNAFKAAMKKESERLGLI